MRPGRKNPHAQALARLGAAEGGRARWARLTPEERTALARRLAQIRWARARQQPPPHPEAIDN